MAKNKLTDTKIRNSKAKEKNYVLADGENLQILIKTNGSKLWEVRYRFEVIWLHYFIQRTQAVL